MTSTAALELLAVPGIPMVQSGDDLASTIAAGLKSGAMQPRAGDVVVLAQKIVSRPRAAASIWPR